MAAQNSLDCEPAALPCAVFFDRFQRIGGAGRRIPATGSHVRRDSGTIKSNAQNHDFLHHDLFSFFRLQQSQLFQTAQVRTFYALIRCIHRAKTCHHNEVRIGLELIQMQPVCFANQSFDAVSLHRTAQLYADRNTKPPCTKFIVHGIDNQTIRGRRAASSIQSAEITVFL